MTNIKKRRVSKYDNQFHPVIVRWMVRAGLNDEEIARELSLHRSTLYRWKDKYPEFAQAFAETKPFIDALVEDALLKRALGYQYTETEIRTDEQGRTMEKTVTRQVVPDVTAQIFWLKNRQPERWRDKQDVNVKAEVTNRHEYEITQRLITDPEGIDLAHKLLERAHLGHTGGVRMDGQ